jgi:hypothetical protein
MHLVYIGVLGSQRHREFMANVAQSHSRLSYTAIDYQEVIAEPELFGRRFSDESIFRLDSTAQSFSLQKLLLRLGASTAEEEKCSFLPVNEIDQFRERFGEFIYPSQYYYGLNKLMQIINEQVKCRERWLTKPDIAGLLFDKAKVVEICEAEGIPAPMRLFECYSLSDIQGWMNTQNLREVYVKHRFGSSACGIALLRTVGTEIFAITSVANHNGRRWNSLRPRSLRGEQSVGELVNYLINEGAQIEVGIPKRRIDGMGFDCRFIVINNRIDFIIVRKSRAPFTNLHMGGVRDTFQALKTCVSASLLQEASDACLKLAQLFDQFVLGVDIVFSKKSDTFYVLEVNSFGAFFPNLRREGRTVLDWELNAIKTTFGC